MHFSGLHSRTVFDATDAAPVALPPLCIFSAPFGDVAQRVARVLRPVRMGSYKRRLPPSFMQITKDFTLPVQFHIAGPWVLAIRDSMSVFLFLKNRSDVDLIQGQIPHFVYVPGQKLCFRQTCGSIWLPRVSADRVSACS